MTRSDFTSIKFVFLITRPTFNSSRYEIFVNSRLNTMHIRSGIMCSISDHHGYGLYNHSVSLVSSDTMTTQKKSPLTRNEESMHFVFSQMRKHN
ncbi:hypothetical protein Scep_001855 [Stephania cephalantha]|uniref:Uncharacterized protein n=1 Tax=Stephania cephalantha TaxID=152367 RepID=A0AAP0LCT9_9MAGN